MGREKRAEVISTPPLCSKVILSADPSHILDLTTR